jgi:hypothetical protein
VSSQMNGHVRSHARGPASPRFIKAGRGDDEYGSQVALQFRTTSPTELAEATWRASTRSRRFGGA